MIGTSEDRAGGRWAWVAGWLLAAVILCAGYGAGALRQSFLDPDNAMRLVEVRDWLGGQAWFDNVQHRLNPPDGVLMHWARTVDLLIGAPIAVLTPFVGARNAEIAVSFLYPFAWLAGFMWLASEIAGEIGARDGLRKETRLAGALVAALAFPAMGKFAPGGFDHHNVELTLVSAAVLCLMRMRATPWIGALGGAALGFAMSTAAEGAPFVAAALGVAGLLWLIRPEAYRRGLAWLGGGLAAASLVSFLVLVPPMRWGAPVCDSMGAPFLGFGLAGGAVALALAFLPDRFAASVNGRLGASVVFTGAALCALLMLFPACAGGGYAAVSDGMKTLWMAQVSESRSLIQLASSDLAGFATAAGAPFAGLVAGVIYLRRHWRHADGWIVMGFLATAWALLLWQIRGAGFATIFAIPFGGWAVTSARIAFRVQPNILRALAFLGVAGSSAAAAWASAGDFAQHRLLPHSQLAGYQSRKATLQDCLEPKNLAPLAGLKPGVIMNPFSLGPAILQVTGNSVIAAPYHRNGPGIMAMINTMRASPDVAHLLVEKTGASYLVVCEALPEASFYAHHPAAGVAPEQTLSARLTAGEPPAWLEPIDIGASPLKLYRIRR